MIYLFIYLFYREDDFHTLTNIYQKEKYLLKIDHKGFFFVSKKKKNKI